ncbi:MAG: branched chain amino acid aminotransferase, partial [Clostridiaceae bacterium]|nr:branched chain amino acid aminotransferase [Clostridiaceae bacterium]
KEGLNPVKIFVESHYVRAVKGGLVEAKASANYAASLKAQEMAAKNGYTQVLWLDGVERKYVEEVGTMNVFFVIGDEVVTPALNGSILPGITRKSSLELLRSWGLNVSERRISIQEIYDAADNGQLKEAFGTGTAAVISPIGELCWNDKRLSLSDGKIGELSQKLYDNITGIQYTKLSDQFNWIVKI